MDWHAVVSVVVIAVIVYDWNCFESLLRNGEHSSLWHRSKRVRSPIAHFHSVLNFHSWEEYESHLYGQLWVKLYLYNSTSLIHHEIKKKQLTIFKNSDLMQSLLILHEYENLMKFVLLCMYLPNLSARAGCKKRSIF